MIYNQNETEKDNKKREKSNEGDDNMGTVMAFERKEEKFIPATILEMLSNPLKRKQTYDYYDSIYEETEEEKEIFEAWKKRRTRKD